MLGRQGSPNLCRTQPGSLSFFFHASDLYWGDQKLDLKLGQKVDLGQLVAPSDLADFTVAYGNKGQLVATEVSLELVLSQYFLLSASTEAEQDEQVHIESTVPSKPQQPYDQQQPKQEDTRASAQPSVPAQDSQRPPKETRAPAMQVVLPQQS